MADLAKENEEYGDDKYMLTPEEEEAFSLDALGDLMGEGDWEGKDYDLFADDALSDNEFDEMMQEIANARKMPAMPQEPSGKAAGQQEKGGEAKSPAAPGELLADSAQTLPGALGPIGEDSISVADIGGEDRVPVPEAAEDITEKIDTPGGNDFDLSETMGERESSMVTAPSETENEELNGEMEGEGQEDILDLINSIYSSEEGASLSQTDDMASGEQYGTEDDLEMSRNPEDFSDMLSDLSDEDLASIQDINMMDGEAEEPSGEKEKKGKKKKEKKKKEKPSIWKRLFGNVKTERSEEEIAQMKEKVLADAEAKEAAKEAKIKQAAAQKEEKKKKAAENKAAAAKKKQENEKKKAEAAKAKQEAKDKKKQEVQNLIDAIDEDEGKINRIGASIVFVFFAIVAVAILIGTKMYSYKQSVENARESFEFNHYNEAYEEIAGIDEMKDEDETFALQVKVVMYTYKQLNSFHHYYAAGLYPEALDSLLKGLKRYDKYATIATVLQIDEKLSSVRGEILDELSKVYGLTEQDAVTLMAVKDRAAYTQSVYEIASHMD